MQRRAFVRALGATAGVTITGALAGCSDSGGSSGGPFSATIDGPYSDEAAPDSGYVYARLTLENPPDDWPEEGYYSAWAGEKGQESKEAMSGLYADWEEQPYRFEQSDFSDDGTASVNAHLGAKNELESGTTFVFSVRSPETDEEFELGEITYEGNAEQRDLEPRPTQSE